METRQLRYFVAIVEAGNLTKAAEHVFVAQPALSRQMVALEKELGVTLLTRSSQGVIPTAEGRIFYQHAVAVLRQLKQAAKDVRKPSAVSDAVNVGLPSALAPRLGYALIDKLRAESGLRIRLHEGPSAAIADLLHTGRLDLAIHFEGASGARTSCETLFDDQLHLVGQDAATIAGEHEHCRWSEIADVPLVLVDPAHGLGRQIITSAGVERSALNVTAELDSLSSLLAAVDNLPVCTILPRVLISAEFAARHPVRPLAEPAAKCPIDLCWSTDSEKSEPVRRVRNAVFEIASGFLAPAPQLAMPATAA